MTRNEAILYIQQETCLPSEQKDALIKKLFTHPCHFLLILNLVAVMNRLISERFHELSYAEKLSVALTLARNMEGRKLNCLFHELRDIFFEDESSFLEVVLKRYRTETSHKIKALMFEILLSFSKEPLPGATLEDYLAGLHHDDELVRLKVLHFLFGAYREKILVPILKEIPEMKPPPSSLFYRTLVHFLYLHPEIDWIKDVKGMLEAAQVGSSDAKSDKWILYDALTDLLERHQVLSISMDPIQGKIAQEIAQTSGREESELDPQRQLTGFRLERFEKIGSKSEWR